MGLWSWAPNWGKLGIINRGKLLLQGCSNPNTYKTHTETPIRIAHTHRHKLAYVLDGMWQEYCNKERQKAQANGDI